MFKKLRNKFLTLNMIMISILLVSAFCVVFMMTYNNINTAVNIQLDRGISNIQPKGQRFFNPFQSDPNMNRKEIFPHIPNNEGPAPDEPSSLKLDLDGNIMQTRSPYEYDEEFYTTIKDDAIKRIKSNSSNNNTKTSHIIKYDDSYWKYLIISSYETDTSGNEIAVYYLSISNINTQIGMLQKLIITLSIVLLAALILVFLICLFFANRSIKPIEDAWNKQNQFIADASHELKTPLTTINTNIDLLMTHGDSTIKEEKKWLNYIKDESTRMAKLTNDLLYLAKVDHSSENNIIKSTFSFSSAAENVILTTEAVIYEKSLNLVEDLDDEIYISGDESQIKQLVLILLDNAIKYTNQGGTIEVTLKKLDNKTARFIIKNTGNGIPPEDISKIFDRFYRSDKSRDRKSGGYGLGLSIAKSIVVSHKGTIKLKSEPNKFTEFIVELPISQQT